MAAHPTLRTKLLRDIRRSWALFTALVVTVTLGIALYAAADNSYQNLTTSYDNAFTVQGFPDLFVTGGDIESVAATAKDTDGVAATRTRVQADLPMTIGQEKPVGRVVGYPADGTPQVAALTILDGQANPGPGQALVEEHMWDTFDLSIGDTITLTTAIGEVDVEAAGKVSSAEYLWPAPSRQEFIVPAESFGVLFVTDEDARTWSGAPDNQSLVLLTDSARTGGDVLASLRSTAISEGATEVLDREQQPSNSVLQEDISGFQQMAVAFPALFLSAAALALYVLLTRRVAEERQIIGTLRAAGMRARTLGWHYLSYGLLAGVIGALLGLPLGIAMAGAMSRMYVAVIGLPDQLTVIEAFRLETVLVGLAFAVIATAIAGWFPARRAAKILPAEAMRGEVPDTRSGRSWVERVIPGSQHWGAHWSMILRGIGRNARRTVFTAAGVSLALILVLVSWGMIDTMQNVVTVQFTQVATNNGQAQYQQPIGRSQLDQLESVAGVSDAESVINRAVSIGYDGTVYATAFTAFDADTVMHGFIDEDGDPVPLTDDGVLIDQGITAQIPDLAPGDRVDLTFPGLGDTKVTATVTDFSYQPLGTFVYGTKTWAEQNIAEAPATTALLTTDADADPDQVRRDVAALPGVVAYAETSALQDTYNQFAGLFYVFVGAMLALGAAMAFAIIFTTMSVNIVERQRELATLRAAGVRHRTLAGLVGGENTIVAALGVVPGLILGVASAQVMLQTYSNDQFILDLSIKPLTLVLSAAAIMGVAIASQIPGLRALRRMNVAEVVRERAA